MNLSLGNFVETIQCYSGSRKEKVFSRDPIFEVMFQKKIPKYGEELTEWTMLAILAINALAIQWEGAKY